MIRKSKLVLIAAVATVGIAAPALAQSFDPDAGTGNLVSGNIAPATSQTIVAAPTRGLRAYGMVPHISAAPAATDPAVTDPAVNGGGSTGYNEMLLQY